VFKLLAGLAENGPATIIGPITAGREIRISGGQDAGYQRIRISGKASQPVAI